MAQRPRSSATEEGASHDGSLAGMFSGLQIAAGVGPLGTSLGNDGKIPRSTSDPSYVHVYYANRSLNPRLPPPSASASRPLQWTGGSSLPREASAFQAEQVK